MELKDIQRNERRKVVTTIRTYPSYANWMKENKVSPSRLFNMAVKELIEENKQNSKGE